MVSQLTEDIALPSTPTCAGTRKACSCWNGECSIWSRRLVSLCLLRSSVIEYINTKEGVEWVTMEQICDDFKSKNQPPKGAMMPAATGAILENPDLKLELKE